MSVKVAREPFTFTSWAFNPAAYQPEMVWLSKVFMALSKVPMTTLNRLSPTLKTVALVCKSGARVGRFRSGARFLGSWQRQTYFTADGFAISFVELQNLQVTLYVTFLFPVVVSSEVGCPLCKAGPKRSVSVSVFESDVLLIAPH